VKYRSGAAFRQALEQRLLMRSRDRSTSLVRLRKAVVFDRLLVRLAIAARDRWVLKGALALDFRLGERSRTTKDMDLVPRDNEAAASSDFIAAQAVDLDDFFTFGIEKIGAPQVKRSKAWRSDTASGQSSAAGNSRKSWSTSDSQTRCGGSLKLFAGRTSGIRRYRANRSADLATRTTHCREGSRVHQNLRTRSQEAAAQKIWSILSW
jgi:nucleotidyltransferase AbiEii toxin of type IV toxin-antitoxin system